MKKAKEIGNYHIGIDVGTSSAGWAVMNDEYSIIRHNGKRMWGVNLFDSGQDAQSRRTKRSGRRRLERRKKRIALLQMLMQEDVLKADESFFIKLQTSFLHRYDDFGRTHKYNLFNDKNFTDKDFYSEYPSIYHLRKALIEETKQFDIRLVYLAIHHIIKYRGNFLNEGTSESFNGYSKEYIENYFKEMGESAEGYLDKIDEIENILLDNSKRRGDKIDEIKALYLSKYDKAFIAQFAKAVLGQKFELGTICVQDNIIGENGKPITISFSDSDYEEKAEEYADMVGDGAPLLGALYSLHFALTFKEILGENDFISFAMCDKYDTHAKDLYSIKGLMKDHCDEKTYSAFFSANPTLVKDEICYNNYIHRTSKLKNPTKTPNELITEKIFELLDKTTKKQELENDERYQNLITAKETREILPRLNSKLNSAIPHQMNCKELKIILDNQSKYYPSLAKNKEKIISLLTFRRPYYVGVLNKNSAFNWYKKDIEGEIYPWNFYDKVDCAYAQEQFICNLTNNCTIFPEEEVLPMNSFLYSEYMVLDELNKIKIKDKEISKDVKNNMFKDLFKSSIAKTNVTKKDIADWFRKNQMTELSVDDISGLREENKFANIYKPYIDFKKILGENFDEKQIPAYEDIIKTLTIFTDAATRIDRIKKVLADSKIDGKQIKALSKLNYKGWGRFSKKVLNGICSTDTNRRSIIQIMRDTTQNFMQIIYDKRYGFESQIKPVREDIKNFYEDCIRPSYCSPAVKKAVNQSVKIILEIVEIMGYAPTSVFIESAEGENLLKKKERPKSRGKMLEEKYNSVDKLDKDDLFNGCMSELKQQLANDKNNKSNISPFSNDKLYLYFTQLGKCMYSGEPLSLSDLQNYEIDHIIPQSLIKDDSLSNKVLVKKKENQYKTDNLVLDKNTIAARTDLWTKLFKTKFIDKKKFYSLTREEFDERDIERFIERQIVETRQSVKEVCEILKQLPQLENTNVVKVLAKSCDTLKTSLGYFKVRPLNDLHHAKDAYIAAVLGRFTSNTACVNLPQFRKEYAKRLWKNIKNGGIGKSQKMRNGIVVDMMNFKFNSMIDKANVEYDSDGNLIKQELQILSPEGEIIWTNEYKDTVVRTLSFNDCLLTKKTEEFANSDFYDETIYDKSNVKAKIPRKMMKDANGNLIPLPTASYGGYNSISSAYAMAIEYKKGKKLERKVVNIPLMYVYANNVETYLTNKYSNYTILKDKEYGKPLIIRKNQILQYKGQLCYFISDSELNNATQIKSRKSWSEALCKVVKANDKKQLLDQNTMTNEQYTKINKQLTAFVEDFLAQLELRFPLYNDIAKRIKDFVDKGGYTLLSFENKQKFILDLLKIVSTAGRTDMNYNSGTDITIKGSGMGRLSLSTINLEDAIFIYRSITGLRQRKIYGKDLIGGDK